MVCPQQQHTLHRPYIHDRIDQFSSKLSRKFDQEEGTHPKQKPQREATYLGKNGALDHGMGA